MSNANRTTKRTLPAWYRGLRPLPTPVKPGAANGCAVLHEGDVEVVRPDGSRAAQGAGRIELKWLPRPAIVVSLPEFVHLLGLGQELRVRLPSGLEFDGYEIAAGYGGLKVEIQRTRQGWLAAQKPPMDRVLFLLANFVETRGAMIRRSKTSRYAGRQEFAVDGWSIKVDLLPDEPQKTLRAGGGFGFTHAVSVRRGDGSTFTAENVEELLVKLYWILSFIRGARAAPVLVAGYVGRQEVWRDWSLRVVDPWSGHHSMFPRHGNLEPLVRSLWELVGHRGARTIETCIHWYVEANNCHGGVEGALIMTLTALERLAWLELVRVRRCLSREGFEKLSAFDKISTLLSVLEIPLDVPVELPDLTAECRKRSPPLNGVRQLCELRNRFVHPPKKDEEDDLPLEMLEEAWRYGLHVLELTMLRLSGYQGQHANRIVHEARPVPWAVALPSTAAPTPATRRRQRRPGKKPS